MCSADVAHSELSGLPERPPRERRAMQHGISVYQSGRPSSYLQVLVFCIRDGTHLALVCQVIARGKFWTLPSVSNPDGSLVFLLLTITTIHGGYPFTSGIWPTSTPLIQTYSNSSSKETSLYGRHVIDFQEWTPLWSTLAPASATCIELLRCVCTKGCHGRCKCRSASLKCTDLCKCAGDRSNWMYRKLQCCKLYWCIYLVLYGSLFHVKLMEYIFLVKEMCFS